MAEEQKATIEFDNHGVLLARPGDSLPPNFYNNFLNMESFRAGYIQSRRGGTHLNNPALGASIHSQGRMVVSGAAVNYQGSSTSIYRNFLEISAGHSGDPVVMEDYKVFNSALPQMIMFERTKRIKDNGTTTTSFGTSKPTAVASAVAAAALTKAIDTCEDKNNYTGSSATLADDAIDPKQGTKSMSITVTTNTTGTATRTISLDLSKFSTVGDGDDDDFIHFWMKVDLPYYLTEIRIQFDCDPTTHDFAKNYYFKSVSPNEITKTVGNYITPDQQRDEIIIGNRGFESDFINDPYYDNLEPVQLEPGQGQWTEFFIKKSDFQRVGSHDNDWANIAAVQILVKTGTLGGVVVNIDDIYMQGGTSNKLDGDYDWRYRYRDSSTGSKGPLSDVMADQVSINKVSATVTVTNPTDTKFDYIDLYRRGGTLPEDWMFVKQTAVGAYSGTVNITDGVKDGSLGEVADIDQIDVSNGAGTEVAPTCFAIWNDRIWIDDPDNPDRVWYSRRFRVEEFTENEYVRAPTGGDRVRRPFALDDQLFIFTDKTVYRVGERGDGAFEALPTGAERGLFSKYAICKGYGLIFYRASDGIYALGSGGRPEKLTEAIDPVFHGISIGADTNLAAVDNAQSASERLEVYDSKLRFAYQGAAGGRYEWIYDLVMKRWYQSDREVTSYLRADDAGKFYVGLSSGFVDETETTNQDAGTDVYMYWQTNYFNFDTPEQDKNFTEVILDVDPGGATFNVTLGFNNGTATSINLAVSGSGRQLIHFPIDSGKGQMAKNIAIGVAANNSDKLVKFYKAHINFWTEPRHMLATAADWSDYGYAGLKFFRRLLIDLDTLGTTANIFVYIDGSTTAINTTTFAAVSTTGREKLSLALPIDTQGKLAKVRVAGTSTTAVKVYGHTFDFITNELESLILQTAYTDLNKPYDKYFTNVELEVNTGGQDVTVNCDIDGVTAQSFTVNTSVRKLVYLSLNKDTRGGVCRITLTATTATKFIYFAHQYYVLDEPARILKGQTEWTNLGYAGDKRFRQLMIQIDTQNQNMTVNVEIDNAVSQALTVRANGRTQLIISLAADTIGKLVRLSFTATTAFSYYGHEFEFLRDPLDVTRYDTYELDFGYTRWKYIRRMWVSGKAPTTVTLTVYVDEVLKTTKTFTLNPLSGWSKVKLVMPAGCKGQLFRFVFTSSTAFKIWLDQSDVEWHPLAGERGYQRAPLARAA